MCGLCVWFGRVCGSVSSSFWRCCLPGSVIWKVCGWVKGGGLGSSAWLPPFSNGAVPPLGVVFFVTTEREQQLKIFVFGNIFTNLTLKNNCCDLQGRKINFTNLKTLVRRSLSRPSVTRVTFDLPECKEPLKKQKKNMKRNASKKKTGKNEKNQKNQKKSFS